MKRIFALLIVFVFTVGYWSCRESNEAFNYNDNLEAAGNNTLAFDIFTDVFKIVHQSFYDSVLIHTGTTEILDAAAEYYHYADDSIIIRVRYPNWNLLCSDGLYRRGLISVLLTESFSDTSGLAFVSFDGYATEDNVVNGKYRVERVVPSGSKPEFSTIASDIEIHMYDSVRTFTWAAAHDVLWDEGSESPRDFSDDVFLFSGTSQGESSTENNFSSEIIQDVHKNRICTWLREGSYRLSTPDLIATDGFVEFTADSCSDRFYMYFNDIMFYEKFLYLFREKEE